ncbi:SdpI family protein [Alteraurantiacibacter aquimixticola]|uniref:DUF1648 domain-containing protein n=1 Tax=Alteraurantiacibacter aquimixticola TaxID=2489173 RepID=A0A4T3F4X0_9SPHN|nr:SdpI family protein [Alteraurantiacibacter aquimixticola]TIX51414.1 hypothetical protein E5222_02835 [Alteraurantiacibacter aquimixticola]
MKVRDLLVVSLLVAAGMVVFAFVAEARMADGAQLPIHWNAAGQPDQFAPALQALLFPAGLLVLIALLFAAIPFMEPLQEKLEGSAPVLRVSWIGLIGLMVLIEAVIGLPAFGITLPVNAIMLGSGALLILVGNALPKSRPGFFVGIRTPWTITDTDIWVATHRLGGKLMMLAGAAIVVAALLPISPEATAIVMLTAVFVAAGIPIAYSWWLWRQKQGAA